VCCDGWLRVAGDQHSTARERGRERAHGGVAHGSRLVQSLQPHGRGRQPVEVYGHTAKPGRRGGRMGVALVHQTIGLRSRGTTSPVKEPWRQLFQFATAPHGKGVMMTTRLISAVLGRTLN